LLKPETLLAFSGQKRWIFLRGMGSPGKVWHDRTLEAVGSTPIGSTNFIKGLDRPTPKGSITQFDALVDLYNTKFATPAKTIMDKLTAAKKLTDQPFDAKIKWTYYELWHHERRRARHGAAMSGPDYAWWHGMYDVAKVFYTEFIPEARQLDPKIVDDTINAMPEHDWFTKGLGKEQVQQILDFYKSRYGQ